MEDVQDQAGNAKGPIFIVGAKGSGTTLARLILDSHPNIAVPQETGFARAVMAQQQIPFWKLGRRWWRRLGYTDEAFRQHLRTFYDDMFHHYARQHGKQRWGEKTPYHVWHITRLRRLFPDAVFIGMVRHPGGNVGSLQGRFKYSVQHGINHWVSENPEILRRARELGNRFILCRYEDLVLQPEATMRELLEWLGEAWSPVVLEHHLVHTQRGTPQQVEGRTRSDDPIDVSRVSKWVGQMSAEGRSLLARRTSRLASVYGYTIDDPAPAEPLGEDGRRLVTGAQIAQLLDAGELRQFKKQSSRRLRDQPMNPRRVTLVRINKKSRNAGGGKSAPQRRRSQSSGAAPPSITRRLFKRLPASMQRRLRAMVS